MHTTAQMGYVGVALSIMRALRGQTYFETPQEGNLAESGSRLPSSQIEK